MAYFNEILVADDESGSPEAGHNMMSGIAVDLWTEGSLVVGGYVVQNP